MCTQMGPRDLAPGPNLETYILGHKQPDGLTERSELPAATPHTIGRGLRRDTPLVARFKSLIRWRSRDE